MLVYNEVFLVLIGLQGLWDKREQLLNQEKLDKVLELARSAVGAEMTG